MFKTHRTVPYFFAKYDMFGSAWTRQNIESFIPLVPISVKPVCKKKARDGHILKSTETLK